MVSVFECSFCIGEALAKFLNVTDSEIWKSIA